ncbi:hypothetical protein GGR52DRAFT_590488 [Hypoxylon sp. FL1284]|nr:hypothetical protein GGR52DRAFT_590488 [Hypoxylon sp. FL1284]
MPPPKASRTNRQEFGKGHEALGSHPVGSWLEMMEKRYPARQILLRGEESSRQSTARPISSEPKHLKPLVNVPGRLPAEVLAERRKGRVFLDADLSRNLYEFPDPEMWEDDSDEDTDESLWEDAVMGDEDIDEVVDIGANGIIPRITVTKPEKAHEENATSSSEGSSPLLDVNYCYKVISIKQERELKMLKRHLLPLAYLVAETENIDVNDVGLLEESLRSIIADREKLLDLYPLAHLLAQDQEMDPEDFGALPQALENVLDDRDNAKRLARYHRATKEKLERRVARMEAEMDRYQDGENYVRL